MIGDQTSISLNVSANSVTYGSTETITATVATRLQTGTPTGSVTFTDQATSAILGTAALTAGTASITINSLTAGTHAIVASYDGDGLDFLGCSSPPVGQISTIAGNGFQNYGGDGGPAASAQICSPSGVAVDAAGDVFIADTYNSCVREVNAATGIITTVAGNGIWGDGGDDVQATAAELGLPCAVAVDASGDLFIADSENDEVFEVGGATGLINIVAGNGVVGCSGDGGQATNAELNDPCGVAVDAGGNLFLADSGNNRIREVNASTHVITTVAGKGAAGCSGDGGQATNAALNDPCGVAVDASGDLFIADSGNNRIREVNATTHVITTVAGNGGRGYSGDGGPATVARLSFPAAVAVDVSGDLFISDGNNVIREVNASTHVITTVAGNGSWGYRGDGGPATSAELDAPGGIALDADGDLFIADTNNNCVREVTASTQVIATFAATRPGDNDPATAVGGLNGPDGVAADASGDLFIADTGNNCIREVNAATGLVTTVAGSGFPGHSGDGGPATAAELHYPGGIAVDASGDLFIADTYNNCVREVNASTGDITTIAGNGVAGYSGDGGQATNAELDRPCSLAVDSDGNLYIADEKNNCIREVNATTGVITTVAGNGTGGFSGDGGLATSAELDSPDGIAVDSGGDLFIADTSNNRIREVNATTHVITTVAGNGTAGYGGDGGQAINAELYYPASIALDASGDLFIADTCNHRIREVNASAGVITTVAGSASYGYGGDGGQATAAQLLEPCDVAWTQSGTFSSSTRAWCGKSCCSRKPSTSLRRCSR